MLGHFHHDVVGGCAAVVIVAGKSLLAGRARGKDLDFTVKAIGAQRIRSTAHFLFLAEANLRGDLRQ
jgi:hypothetical protein